MTRHTIIAGLTALMIFGSGAATDAGEIAGTASVIDGDTIEIHGQRIRLHAIDAIESRQRCQLPDGRSWNCGRDTARALADKIGRRPVNCRVTDVDRYRRLVAICFQGGSFSMPGSCRAVGPSPIGRMAAIMSGPRPRRGRRGAGSGRTHSSCLGIGVASTDKKRPCGRSAHRWN